MASPVWMRTISYVVRKRRLPSEHRRAKWRANWQFDQALRTLGPSDLAIDCGANIGKFTQKMAETGARVYAFEPDPYCVEILREKFSCRSNVTIIDKAVGDADRQMKLYRAEGFEQDPMRLSESSSLFASKTNCDSSVGLPVLQVDLIAFIAGLPKNVSLLKLDVEGAEVPILEKLLMTRTIHRVGKIFAETHETKVPELAQRMTLLRDCIDNNRHKNINLDWK
jgi:FkbM family methyltransferase